ncbi:MAG: signal peptidase I [Verrucomicrobia bacterium]|nr:signal peptidase I [Verrucomicrobiota bacterium]
MSLLRRIIIGSRPKRTFIRTLILAVLCVVIFRYVLRPSITEGQSMEPTIHDGSPHLLNMFAYAWSNPDLGDIVSIKAAGHRVMYLKRVLAGPGDTIAFIDGDLVVNGERVEETYMKYRDSWNMNEKTMGVDEYFVAGDNRGMPMDLHVAGTVKRRHILGRLLW